MKTRKKKKKSFMDSVLRRFIMLQMERRIERLSRINNSLYISLTEKEAEIKQLLAGKCAAPAAAKPCEAPRSPKIHYLKIAPQHLAAVKDGSKPFEVRRADRDYRVGDTLHLEAFADGEYLKSPGGYAQRRITYVLANPDCVKEGFVVLGLAAAGTCQP